MVETMGRLGLGFDWSAYTARLYVPSPWFWKKGMPFYIMENELKDQGIHPNPWFLKPGKYRLYWRKGGAGGFRAVYNLTREEAELAAIVTTLNPDVPYLDLVGHIEGAAYGDEGETVKAV